MPEVMPHYQVFFYPVVKKIVTKALPCQKDTSLRDDLQLSLFKK